MKQIPHLKIALTFSAALVLSTAPARSDTWDKKTTVRFSQSIEVPGAVLQPGTYVMKLMDLSSQRHVVQFMNERENRVYAAAMAIPAYRERVTNATAIGFYEAPAGQPEAMKNWFYPGDNYGQEFLYPKGRGGSPLAVTTKTPPADSSFANRNDPDVSPALKSEGVIPAPAQTDTVASTTPPPTGPVEIAQITPAAQDSAPVIVAQNQTAQPPTESSPADPALPKTASNLPGLAALGSLTLAGAVAVRRLRKPIS